MKNLFLSAARLLERKAVTRTITKTEHRKAAIDDIVTSGPEIRATANHVVMDTNMKTPEF